MIIVKVAQLGSAVKEVAIEDNSPVAQALTAAGVSASGFQIRVNGREATATLRAGDVITLVPAIKGGSDIFVKVAQLGAAVKEVMVPSGSSLEQVLDAAGVNASGFQVRVNGRTPCGSIVNNDVITLVPAIKGGF
jgi:sulfur carrier protein ThiS